MSLREEILQLVEQYCAETFAARAFVPGETNVPVAGRVFDGAEMRLLVDSALDFWLTTGRFADRFEHEFARWLGIRERWRTRRCVSGSTNASGMADGVAGGGGAAGEGEAVASTDMPNTDAAVRRQSIGWNPRRTVVRAVGLVGPPPSPTAYTAGGPLSRPGVARRRNPQEKRPKVSMRGGGTPGAGPGCGTGGIGAGWLVAQRGAARSCPGTL